MRLGDLIADIDIRFTGGDANLEITGITKDSRSVRNGSMFFATQASMPYVSDALKRGAAVIVSEMEPPMPVPCLILSDDVHRLLGKAAAVFFGKPSRHMFMTGITGTNGKTTITYLLESILHKGGRAIGVIGTISYRYGNTTIKAVNTTPGAAEIQELLGDMHRKGTEFVAMEVSSHALDQKRVEGIDFDAAVFTNLTHDHLDYHGDFETYKNVKRLLFTDYLRKSEKKRKCSILNRDDPSVSAFIAEPPVKNLFYSTTTEADARLIEGKEDIDGLSLDICLAGRKIQIKSPLVGMFNASNILAACLIAREMDVSGEAMAEGISSLGGVPGRLERVANERGISAFVDYAHTPDALRKVLDLLNRLKKGRLIVVFGCGGDRDRSKRPVMGNIASRLADVTIVTSDNPRNEEPGQIIEEIRRGFNGSVGPVRIIEDRREAISEGIRMAQEDDVLLVAGKGHEDYQIIGNRTLHFSDRETIEESLNVAR